MFRRMISRCGFAVLATMIVSVFVVDGGAFAATNVSSTISDKAFYQAVYNCYSSGHVDRYVDPLSQYKGAGVKPLEFLTYGSSDSDDNIPLVSGWEGRHYKNNDNGITCHELLNGFSWNGSFGGLMNAFGKTAPGAGDVDGVVKLVENLGYSVNTAGDDKCYGLRYSAETSPGAGLPSSTESGKTTNQVCQKADGSLYASSTEQITKFTASGKNVCIYVSDLLIAEGCKELGGDEFSGEWLMSVIKGACGGMECNWSNGEYSGKVSFDSSVDGGSSSGISLTNSSAQFKNGDSAAASVTAVSYLSDNKITDLAGIRLTPLEKRLLYQAYFKDYYKAELDCREGQSDSAFDGKFYWLDTDKKIKECHYNTSKSPNKSKAVNGVDGRGYYQFESIANLDALAEEIKNLPTDYPSDEIEAADAEGAVSDPSGTDCMGLDLSGQGWVLCPALENGASTSDGFLAMIDGMLSVKSELYNNDSGTFKAWEVFRTFANIFLSVILLVIIISQVTGFGINNYGIKKMLPRFIVVAILINLSYVLCQIAVDVSNILGDGLNNLFQGIAGGIGGTFLWSSGNFVSEVVAGIMGALGAGGAALGFALPLMEATAPLVIIALLLAVLVAVVSILMFFVMLGARMVIIVVFIAIAPVAIACFILPNTQTLYKKWWNIFKAALVMYPLCGLLYGMSFVIKAMFGSSGTPGLWEGIVLILTPFLPFLVLPNLLKSALAGLGVVGGALTSVGNGLRSGLQSGANAVKSTETYKSQAEEVARQRQQRNADNIINRLNKRRQQNGKLDERDTRRLARATETSSRLRAENVAAQTALLEQDYSNKTDDELVKDWVEAFDSGDEKGDLEALTGLLTRRKGAGAVADVTKRLEGLELADENGNLKNSKAAASIEALQRTMRNNSTFAQILSEKAPDVSKMISYGGRTGEGKYGNLGNEAFQPGYLTTDEDFARMSTAAIERAGEQGWLSPAKAQSILDSKVQGVMSKLDEEKIGALQKIANQSTGGDVAIEQGAQAVGAGGVTDTGSAGATLRMTSASGEQVLTRQADGRWVDENGNDMGGNFSTRVENDARLQRQIEENAKKMEAYRNMSDERILELATDPNPKNAKIQASAVEEAKRRGLNQ